MTVLCHTRNHCLVLQLHRPERKNAITWAMYQALTEALAQAEADEHIYVVLLSGCDNMFTSGNDLQELISQPPKNTDSPLLVFLEKLISFSKPLVAAVDGYALGIGTSMLLHCDLVYATERARFQFPFTKLGLVPEAASSYLLPRLAGYPRAAELLLLSEPFDAHTALSLGMINAVLQPEHLESYVEAKLNALTALPSVVLNQTKQLLKASLTPHIRHHMHEETTLFLERLRSPEAREAFQAFFDKRPPNFGKLSS